jgi:hypothetical protein
MTQLPPASSQDGIGLRLQNEGLLAVDDAASILYSDPTRRQLAAAEKSAAQADARAVRAEEGRCRLTL